MKTPANGSREETPAASDLLRRARQGDLAAFEAIYRQHVGRVHAVCRRLSGDEALAEELTQETFLRAWRKLATYRGEGTLAAWLGRVAANLALGLLRRRRRGRDREEPLDETSGLPNAPRRHERPAALDLERAIDALPPGARAAFVLHDVEGYRHEEIALLLGVSAGTSKAQLHRARRLLREALTT